MRRWREGLADPGYNPQWARAGQPFDGLREPAAEEVIAWIDRGLHAQPWRAYPVEHADGREGGSSDAAV
jgi:hypothetical protein